MSTVTPTASSLLDFITLQVSVLPQPLAQIVAEYAIHRILTGVAFMGHVDSGKSTLAGQLVRLLGLVSSSEMDTLEQESMQLGKGSFKYAWIFDKTRYERHRGVSVTPSFFAITTYVPVVTGGSVEYKDESKYILIDCPGHRNFSRSAIKASAYADVMVLVVAAGEGAFDANIVFETGTEGGVASSIKTAIAQGVEDIIIVINKMDSRDVNWGQACYESMIHKVSRILHAQQEDASHYFTTMTFVPVSAWYGDNVIKASIRMPWYKGPTFLELLNSITPIKSKKFSHGPLRMIGSVIRASPSAQHLLRAKVLSGYVEEGAEVSVLQRAGRRDRDKSGKNLAGSLLLQSFPSRYGSIGIEGPVLSLQSAHQSVPLAGQGDIVGLKMGYSSKELALSEGGVVIGPRGDPPRMAVRAIVDVFRSRNMFNQGIIGKYTPTMHVNTFSGEARWERLLALHPEPLDLSNANIEEQKLKQNRVVTIEVVFIRKMYIGPEHCLRCLFRDNGNIVALGKILAYQVLIGENLEWRDKSGSSISSIVEWESKLPYVAIAVAGQQQQREQTGDAEVVTTNKQQQQEETNTVASTVIQQDQTGAVGAGKGV